MTIFLRPESIEEACAALAAAPEDNVLLAGGQTLLHDRAAGIGTAAPKIMDLGGIKGLGRIFSQRNALFTGAMVTLEDAARDPDIAATTPLLAQIAAQAAPPLVRRRATLGGSIMLADARGHLPLLFLAMGGLAVFENSTRRREVAADDLFTGWRQTCRAPDELLTGLLWPGQRAATGAGYDILPGLQADDSGHLWPDLGVAVYVQLHSRGTIRLVRIALSGIADRPVLAELTPDIQQLPVAAAVYELSDQAAAMLETSSLTGPPDYRQQAIRDMARRLLQDAFDTAVSAISQTTSP